MGVKYYGLVAFAGATIAILSILTDFGFNLSATKEVSIYRSDKEKLTEIFSSVMIIKTVLMLISFIILTIVVFSFYKFRKDWLIYFFTFGTVIGQVLFTVWFFQGMERMKFITYLNILSRLIFTASIFIFVRSRSDYIYVPLLTSLGTIIAGIASLLIIFKNFGVKLKLQKFSVIKYYISNSIHLFISTVAINIYTSSTTFILGLFTNNVIVGYFAAGYKIVQVFTGLTVPISQSLYPYIVKKVHKSKEEGLRIIRKVTLYIGLFSGVISLFILFFSVPITDLILGDKYINSIVVLRIMSVLPFMIGLSNIFGIQTMLSFDRKKAFSSILIAGSILNILLSLILVPKYFYIGSAVSVSAVECFITVSMFIYLQKKGLKIFNYGFNGRIKNV